MFVDVFGGPLVNDPALPDHQHPIGEPQHLGYLAAQQNDRLTGIG